jgi:hypothetical protein
MADGAPQTAQDPYAEFGGQTIQVNTNPTAPAPAASDPYAEFGGQSFASANVSPQDMAIRQSQQDLTATPKDIAVGMGKGALKTAVGIGELASKATGSNQNVEGVLAKGRALAEPKNIGEGAGNVGEEGIEWLIGEEGLKTLTSVSEIATRAPEIMQILEDYPTASKVIISMLKGGTVGGVQGGIKGAAEGDAAGGAKSGAEGGAVGSLLAELGIAGAQKVGEAVGIGRDSLAEATRSGKPGKWNTRWEDDWNRALPELVKKLPDIKGKGVEGVSDAALTASDELWNNQVKPMIKTHENDLKDVAPVADAIRAKITPSLTKYSPEAAKGAEELANKFSGPGPKSMMSIKEMEADIEHLNSELAAEGWWKLKASERAAAIKAGTASGMKSVAADALREQVYNHINSFGGNNIDELKKTYGALRNVENEFRGQVNVQNRQSAISLKKMIGATAGAAAGGPAGALAAVLPIADARINSPDAMAERAVKAGRPESTVTKITKAVAKKTTQAAGGVAGERAAEKTANTGEDAWVHILGSDGNHYEVHPQDLRLALAADKGAKIVVAGKE